MTMTETSAIAATTTSLPTPLTPLQHAFAIHLLHRAWLHLLQNHSVSGWPTDWNSMNLLADIDQHLTGEHDFSQPVTPSHLIQLSIALSQWREGQFPADWDQDFTLQS